MTCDVTDERNKKIAVTIDDANAESISLKYLPPASGIYRVSIGYGGRIIPGGEFNQQVC